MKEVNRNLAPQTLTEKYSMRGLKKVKGHKVQVFIGGISVGNEQVDVEVLPGCSRDGLLDTMQKITAETGKPVKAIFNEQEVAIQPKK
ncbi:MAG: hypothetical protein Q8P53_02380 [Candidatus Shapirobacteria bacterium]|nr:hypothetical protein [Candidatus Shapirobacteria bacterium]